MIEAQESARAAKAAEAHRRYAVEFITGPTLALPLGKFDFTFDPRGVESFGEYGTVYHSLQVRDVWGKLVVDGGDALITKDFKNVIVAAAPANGSSTSIGKGWTISLAHGFAMNADPKRAKSFVLSEKKHQ